jgi:hypothetical protein
MSIEFHDVNGNASMITKPDKVEFLDWLQSLVGGHIELYTNIPGKTIVFNEEGRIRFSENVAVSRHLGFPVFGNVVVFPSEVFDRYDEAVDCDEADTHESTNDSRHESINVRHVTTNDTKHVTTNDVKYDAKNMY